MRPDDPEGQRGSSGVQTAVWRAALLLGFAGLSRIADAQQQPPPEQPAQQQEQAEKKAEDKAKRRPRRLLLDIEKHVERKLAEEAKLSPPRFETSIEVVARSPQVLLERFFGGIDLECGPGGGGAPSVEEMREHRPHAPPTADLMALAMALAGKVMDKVKGKQTPRYYLYAVRRASAVNYALREERVPDAWFYNFPGVSFELVESFADKDTAVRAWRRMERGFGTPVGPKVEAAPPQWATAPCRPRR